MKRNILVLLAFFTVIGCLIGCNQKSRPNMIQEGMTREQVIEKFGNPKGELSGIDGEVFEINGESIVVHYQTNEDNKRIVSFVGSVDNAN